MRRNTHFFTSLRNGLVCATLMLASSVMAHNQYFEGYSIPSAPTKGITPEMQELNKPAKVQSPTDLPVDGRVDVIVCKDADGNELGVYAVSDHPSVKYVLKDGVCHAVVTVAGQQKLSVALAGTDLLDVTYDKRQLGAMIKSTLAIGEARYGTFVAPYDVNLPEGVKAWTVPAVDKSNDATLILEEVKGKLPANTPVVVYSETPVEKEYYLPMVQGIPQEGIMVGVLVSTDIRSGYVLQNQNGLVGFYQVSGIKTVPANRAYIAQSASTEGVDDERVKAYFFDSATALKAIDVMTNGKAEIYDLNGRKQTSLQKGINIVNGVKVLVK